MSLPSDSALEPLFTLDHSVLGRFDRPVFALDNPERDPPTGACVWAVARLGVAGSTIGLRADAGAWLGGLRLGSLWPGGVSGGWDD